MVFRDRSANAMYEAIKSNRKGHLSTFVKRSYFYLAISVILTISGCAFTPAHERIARENQWRINKLETNFFEHVVISKQNRGEGPIFVFIEGDGRPWVMRHLISSDPTPSKILTLNLMENTPFDSVFIGRPCYFGLAQSKNCTKKFWTSHRYSPEIINSMAQIIDKVRSPSQSLTLVGHSGGGSIATLLAAKVSTPVNVITIAGNLDTEAWVRLHGYYPLHGSLNPISHANLKGVLHLHFAGGRDENVPATQIKNFSQRHNGKYWVQPKFDHVCCWTKEWSSILSILETTKLNGV